VPYGLTAVEGALRVDLDEQRVVERVLAMRAAGDSYRVICDALEAEGFRPRGGPAEDDAEFAKLINELMDILKPVRHAGKKTGLSQLRAIEAAYK